MKTRLSLLAATAAALVSACSNDDTGPCSIALNAGCTGNLICDSVAGEDQPQCLPPVVLRGHIGDYSTHTDVRDARILFLGDDGVPLAPAGTTAADGTFAVRVHAPRSATLAPLTLHATPWVQAQGYGQFPDDWRPAGTLDAASAVSTPITVGTTMATELTLTSGATDILLIPFGGGPGNGILAGTVNVPSPAHSILVVATSTDAGTPFGASGLADSTGSFRIFGLLPAHYSVTAHAQGLSYLAIPTTVSSGETVSINVPRDNAGAATVTGRLQLSGVGRPSVALYVASTYNSVDGRGDVPRGMTTTTAVDGSFSIAGVSAGSYVVVPSPENDGLALVGPPPVVDVVAGQNRTLAAPIPVATAITIIGPGAEAPEMVTSAPTLRWADVMDESGYRLSVATGAGDLAWEVNVLPGTVNHAVPFGGTFSPGTFYRFKVEALDAQGAPFAASETLRGIFFTPGQ